jgi:hypothetical protein
LRVISEAITYFLTMRLQPLGPWRYRSDLKKSNTYNGRERYVDFILSYAVAVSGHIESMMPAENIFLVSRQLIIG